MMEIKTGSWITVSQDTDSICPVFRKMFAAEKAMKKAELEITALGIYEAELNGQRVSNFVLAPGWTSYDHRLQVQTYDVTVLLQRENDLRVTVDRGWFRFPMPGWLYPVTKGATTIWEHWDGIHEDGSFWSRDMNSFNHYAYGSVADWVFEQAADIQHAENKPGFEELIYAPHPDKRLGWLQARLDTRRGTVSALWVCREDGIRYELETPVQTKVCLNGKETWVNPGKYTFWTEKSEYSC